MTNNRPNLVRGRQNTFRFMPGREVATDNQILFPSFRYSRNAVVNEAKGVLVGIGIGPGQHRDEDAEKPGLILEAGGKIIPAMPNEKRQAVPVRDYTPPNDKTGKPKKYVDWATFQRVGDKLFAVPYKEDKVVYVEVWTGDFDKETRDSTLQFIQAGVFDHGSVAYAGGEIVINAPSVRSGRSKDDADRNLPDVGARATTAELVSERRGDIVGGVPLWIARMWRLHYSATDSEWLLVRQLDRFWLVYVDNGLLDYNEIEPEAVKGYKGEFENLTIDQKLIPAPGQTEASVAA